jgi:putative transposase
VYHVCNRGSRKGMILETYEDYAAFCQLVEDTRRKSAMRILAYCLLKTHFHFVLWPVNTFDLPRFMKRLTQTHAQRFHRQRGTVGCGAVYQSRYFARMLIDDRKYFGALRYVEANALRHGVVDRAEQWPWGSACNRERIGVTVAIEDSPLPRPSNWSEFLNDL